MGTSTSAAPDLGAPRIRGSPPRLGDGQIGRIEVYVHWTFVLLVAWIAEWLLLHTLKRT